MINITLIIQAGNFVLAYIMIRILLLRPAVNAINEDEATYERAVTSITTQKDRVQLQEERIKERWHSFQKTFLEHEPAVAKVREVDISVVPGMPELPAIDEKKAEKLARDTAQKLVEKVADVY